jgi:hypothetical protein
MPAMQPASELVCGLPDKDRQAIASASLLEYLASMFMVCLPRYSSSSPCIYVEMLPVSVESERSAVDCLPL